MSKPEAYKYKFSFIIPVYNVEDFLAETVESVIAQTMDFEQNCEIIFINDGSPDNSEEVCLRYKQQFPNNVTYIKQENAGVAAARNRGIERAQGKYISMVDSDDYISRDTLSEVYDFLERHHDEIDLVAIKQMFFEARKGQHPLNYKFTHDRVIDLKKDHDQIQMAVTSAFFKSGVLKKCMFDESIGRYAEDSSLMARVLLKKQKFGVVTKPTYFYRKRLDQASSLDTTMKDPYWYLETPKRAWKNLLEETKKQYKTIPKFIQFMIMYDLQWRIKQAQQVALTDDEVAQYKDLIYGLFRYIDDDIIASQRQIDAAYKIFALTKKHNKDVASLVKQKGKKYLYGDVEVYDAAKEVPSVNIEILEAKDNIFIFEGFYTGVLFNDEKLCFVVNGTQYLVEKVDRPLKYKTFLGDIVSDGNCFKVELPQAEGNIEVRVSGNKAMKPQLVARRFSYLSQVAKLSYRTCGDFILCKRGDHITVTKRTPLARLSAELTYWFALLRRLKLGVVRELQSDWKQSNTLRSDGLTPTTIKPIARELRWVLIPLKSMLRNAYVILLRFIYFVIKPFFRRPVWIVSDRVMAADDNGEVFFRYLSKQPDVPANVYFALSKRSGEFAGVQKYGKVVNYNGFYYKLLFLLSDKIISSEAADYVINPFKGHVDDFVDLFKFDFVFLQHGIIKDDISGWLNRYEKNIKLFVTSTKPEYESILTGTYGYGSDVVKLTGLPRYDLLKSKPKRKLLLMPTWRDNLAGGIDPVDGRRLYNPNFKKSEYFAFYQNLINDDRIKDVLKKHKFTGELYLHPSFQRQIKDFTGNEQFKIMQMPFDYPKAKREGNLLVTDYSSVAFDFAYLKKPVIYTHFDEDNFYKTHTSREGYFSYEDNGFGPVVYNYEDTVEVIVKTIESECMMPKKYQNRVEKFFYRFDQDNSKRVYEEIKLLSKTT